MSRTNFDRMARDNTRLIREAHGLAALWRKIVAERDINAEQLYGLITRWVNEHQFRETDHGKIRSNDRGNMIKALGKNRISWKVFMKGIQILRPQGIELVANVTWRKNSVTSHSININMNLFDPEIEEELTEDDINDVELHLDPSETTQHIVDGSGDIMSND